MYIMKKKIQITAIVKEFKKLTLRDTGKTVEDFMRVEYETGKHDSISDAEAERNKAQSDFTAEQIENDYLRLQAQLDIAQKEGEIE